MPIANYGVLKGKAFDRIRATTKDEHFHILINRGDMPHRIAINTKSNEGPSQVLYYADDDFHHEITDALQQSNLQSGYTALDSKPGGLALDFIRRNLFDTSKMVPLPTNGSGGDTDDLNDRLDFFVQQAITDPSAVIYAFGQHWLDAQGADHYFPEINPSTGIHDIHMNQGNPKGGKYYNDNGPWQDGGLIFHFASRNRWAAVFTAFQSQSFHTDDAGNPTTSIPDPHDTLVRIIAAMVNPVGTDSGKEYVILLNKSNKDVNISGWQIVDKLKKKDTIGNETIPAGNTLRINLSGEGAQLTNKGGTITLLNKDNQKIDGVTYTKNDAAREGQLVEL